MKNPEMLKFVSDHLKTKKMSKHVVKKLPYLWRYLPDQYAIQRIGDKAILENGRTLKSVPDCYKNQEMRNKAVDNYPHWLKFALEREWSKVSKSEKKNVPWSCQYLSFCNTICSWMLYDSRNVW